jgi:hypothetical protein
MADRFVWTANLSNGDTHAEAELTVAGENSAFQKLMAIMKEKAATITGFRFQNKGVTHNAPSMSPKAKFPSSIPVTLFPTDEVPFTLDYRRRATQAFMADGKMVEERFCRYIVRAEGLKISLWLEDATGDTWMQIEKEVG